MTQEEKDKLLSKLQAILKELYDSVEDRNDHFEYFENGYSSGYHTAIADVMNAIDKL